MKIAADSSEHVHVPVSASTAAGDLIDLSADTVEIGFLAEGADNSTTSWNAAAWESGASGTVASVLVGPTGVVLAPGLYQVRVRVTTQTEQPTMSAGWLSVEG